MKILFIGDIFGNSGRRAVSELVNKLKQEENIDFVIANAENTSNGKGVSKEHFELLSKSGIDFFTMGNHTWDNLDIYDIFKNNYNIIRPGNVGSNESKSSWKARGWIILCDSYHLFMLCEATYQPVTVIIGH